jgi:hypothetical protein
MRTPIKLLALIGGATTTFGVTSLLGKLKILGSGDNSSPEVTLIES